ncbi:DMT family transporter [Pseudolabrys sp. FHR47]|uniref:DMT family transporter n=1 Tax=Pseudolabrys sp. FHR47 TaxID=2562284 RepID=UPI00143D6C49|nr:DMT family transporter [Pseudolabrys sp. FHR47]
MQASPPKSGISPSGKTPGLLMGALCGVGAALAWAAGFAVAKHGISIGLTPADLAIHRYFWTGLLLIPLIVRDGVTDLGGVGWGRGFILAALSGPTQALVAYTGFIYVPFGHGTTIQPATAALAGIVLAAVLLKERLSASRVVGAATIIAGLVVFGIESFATIGTHGIGGDLLFATAGALWALFGILLRQWRVTGMRVAAAVGLMSVLVYSPIYFLFIGTENMLRFGWGENLLQIVVQGLVAGVLPIFLFARAVTLLGAGRASTFPALVPGFSLIIGFLALGIVPTIAQLIGLATVLVGFRFALR